MTFCLHYSAINYRLVEGQVQGGREGGGIQVKKEGRKKGAEGY